MTFCHAARKGGYNGSHWPKHVRASALLDVLSVLGVESGGRPLWLRLRRAMSWRFGNRDLNRRDAKNVANRGVWARRRGMGGVTNRGGSSERSTLFRLPRERLGGLGRGDGSMLLPAPQSAAAPPAAERGFQVAEVIQSEHAAVPPRRASRFRRHHHLLAAKNQMKPFGLGFRAGAKNVKFG